MHVADVSAGPACPDGAHRSQFDDAAVSAIQALGLAFPQPQAEVDRWRVEVRIDHDIADASMLQHRLDQVQVEVAATREQEHPGRNHAGRFHAPLSSSYAQFAGALWRSCGRERAASGFGQAQRSSQSRHFSRSRLPLDQ